MPLLDRRRSETDLLNTPSHGLERIDTNVVGQAEIYRPGTALLSHPRQNSEHTAVLSSPVLASESGSPSSPAPRNFSMRLSRHLSEGELVLKARQHAEPEQRPAAPSMPARLEQPAQSPTPVMTITPAPDTAQLNVSKKRARGNPFKRQKSKVGQDLATPAAQPSPQKEETKSIFAWGRRSMDAKRAGDDFAREQASPPPPSPSLIPPQVLHERLSMVEDRDDSARVGKKPSLFSLPRREKRKSLFPLPPKVEPTAQPQYPDTAPATPRESTSGVSQHSVAELATFRQSPYKQGGSIADYESHGLHGSASQSALPRNNVSFAPVGYSLARHDSNSSAPSNHSSPNMVPPRRFGVRDRASTNSTFGRPSDDATPPTPPTLNGSTRNSTSTGGRASLGGFLTLHRFRGTEASGMRHDSPGPNSKSNSITVSRDTIALPEREDGETAAKYLERLQGLASRNVIAGVLSKSSDPFFQTVLRSYTRRFAFFGEPIDMSLRKFLLEAELPKETQQVDRVIQAFADRYHECNPGVFIAPDSAYIIAFSLMMLHTDAFNKNNKHKMQKGDYVKNTRGQAVSEDVLACFYDNICYTPFIHFDEDDFEGSTDRLSTFKTKKTKLKGAMPDAAKKTSGPVDPYYLIIENKLDALRPAIKESIAFDDPYAYLPPGKPLNAARLQMKFKFGGVIQIISARSRPAAFESETSRDNPEESKPGVVDLQVTKVGILWRKAAKRKKTRSPWQEWGAILTGSQLYFFKNVSWIKSLMQQYNNHQKHMVPPSSVVFKPPLEDFKPDSITKTDDAVALLDATYNRHKHAFTLIRHGGEEEVLLADNESELQEWLGLINYAAAFRSAGVRIRGHVNFNNTFATPRRPTLPSSGSERTGLNNDHGRQGSVEPDMERLILAARRRQMIAKMAEAEVKLADGMKRLDDLLRNARQLQILAPIQPKSREVVIHSAAKMDAMLKWTRREIWRTKCYKDILNTDALEDDDEVRREAERMRPMSTYPVLEDEIEVHASHADEETLSAASFLASSRTTSRPATTSSMPRALADDVFETPPTSAHPVGDESRSWQSTPVELPADSLPLGVTNIERQSSVSSIVPSDLSVRRPSVTLLSSGSSGIDVARVPTATTDDVGRTLSTTTDNAPVTPNSHGRREPLSHNTSSATAASGSRRPSVSEPAAFVNATPESVTKTRSHRKSLHRTLRDGIHEHGSVHRHRKGKESASTIKSDNAQAEAEDTVDGTPGLERREGRFILHGKQASVITFGEGLDGAAMRMSSVSSRRNNPALNGRRSFSDNRYDAGHTSNALGIQAGDGHPRLSRQRSRTASSTDTRSEIWQTATPTNKRHSLAADALTADAYVTGGASSNDEDDHGDEDDGRNGLTPRHSTSSLGSEDRRSSFAREDSGGEFYDAPGEASDVDAEDRGTGPGASRWVSDSLGGADESGSDGEGEGAGDVTPHVGYGGRPRHAVQQQIPVQQALAAELPA